MAILQAILNLLNSVPSEAWEVVVETIVSALVVSPALIGIKKWLSVDSEKKMLALTIIGSLLTGALSYLHGVPQFAPWFALAQGWMILATTQPVYRFLIKPLFKKVSVWFTEQLARATALSEVRNAAVPAEGLPVAPVEDFSR